MSADGTQYGCAGRHHGIGTPDCPRELHHHHDERCERPGADALTDRRQRAREAYYDRYALGDNIGGSARKDAVRECIETATRVRITPEIVAAAEATGDYAYVDMIAAAFAAAGFEIEN